MADQHTTKRDPLDFIPMELVIDIELPATIGQQGKGAIQLNDRAMVVEYVKHGIIPDDTFLEDPGTSYPPPPAEVQDGYYRIDWSLYEQYRFFKGATPLADIAYGNARFGNWKKLDCPVELPGNQTLHVAVQNVITRPNPIIVQVIFSGYQSDSRWAAMQQG